MFQNCRPHFAPGRTYSAVCATCEDPEVVLAEGVALIEATENDARGIVYNPVPVGCPVCGAFHSVPFFFNTTIEAQRAASSIPSNAFLGPLPTGPRIVAIDLLEREIRIE